jgi:hypothetical protein
VARAEIFQSTTQTGNHTLIVVAHDPAIRNVNLVPLHSQQANSPLLLLVDVSFHVEVLTGGADHGRVHAQQTGYKYQLFTSERRELAAFHWHPTSFSRFRTPHLHVSGADPIHLDSSTASGRVGSLNIGKAHFPTRHILLEDVVEFLIADPVFTVEPRRADWRQVLATNRAMADAPNVG